MAEKKVTIKDIAETLGTTYSTVSRALNDQKGVGKQLKIEIVSKAKQMGYQVNHLAQQLRQGQSKQIGLIVPRINRAFFSNVIHGIESMAKKEGYTLLISQTNENEQEELDAIKSMLSNHVAGIILSISSQSLNAKVSNLVQHSQTPIVQFDRTFSDLQTSRVVNDNYQGAYAATVHLIENGFKRIAHFAGPQKIDIYKQRLVGYQTALNHKKYNFDKQLVINNCLTKESGTNAIKTLLSLPQNHRPDAIFSASDFSALSVHLYLQEVNANTPKSPIHIGLVGFANEPFTEYLNITSVEQHPISIGRSAFQLLNYKIQDASEEMTNKTVTVSPHLIIRTSSKNK